MCPLREFYVADRHRPCHGHTGVVGFVADAVEQLQQCLEVLPVDEIPQPRHHGETHVVFGFGSEIGLYEFPHRLPFGRLQAPAETVADRPVVDFGHEARHMLQLLGRRAAGAADHQPLQHPLLEIEILGFGQVCAPVACGDLAGYLAQYRQAYAQYVFHARHQCRGEFHVFRLLEFEQLVAEGHRFRDSGLCRHGQGGSPCAVIVFS